MIRAFPKGMSNPTFAKRYRPSTLPVTLSVSEGLGWVDLSLTTANGTEMTVRMSPEDADLLSKQLAPFPKAPK